MPIGDNKNIRLLTVPVVSNATAWIYTTLTSNSQYHHVQHGGKEYEFRFIPTNEKFVENDVVYNFPFLLNKDLFPWEEANSYLWKLATEQGSLGRRIEEVKSKAYALLEYKMFCEEQNIDYDDFSGRMQSQRPSYRYFNYLAKELCLPAKSVNKKTGVIYYFFDWLINNRGLDLNIDLVDTTKEAKIHFDTSTGSMSKTVKVRKQTMSVSSEPTPVEIGYVREDGEDLRPLNEYQTDLLLDHIGGSDFTVDERLIASLAIYTGMRKQSILTLRMRHLDQFVPRNLRADNTYKIQIGRGTGVDTKKGKIHSIYIEKALADDLKLYANSKVAQTRRNKFRLSFAKDFPDLEPIADEDMYLFLSANGNCHYMAKDDPRYFRVKTLPKGNVTTRLCKRLLACLPKEFPKDFHFHWLRATFALKLYSYLVKLVKKGVIHFGEILQRIQRRMGHSRVETTERYLKLFENVNETKLAQELYEAQLFNGYESEFKTKYESSSKIGDRSVALLRHGVPS